MLYDVFWVFWVIYCSLHTRYFHYHTLDGCLVLLVNLIQQMDCYTYCIIQADIDLIPGKIESLKDLLRNQLETKILWSTVAALKHSKCKYKKQMVTDNFQITPNCYTLLGNNSNDDDDTPANTGRWSKSTISYVRSDKKIIKRAM